MVDELGLRAARDRRPVPRATSRRAPSSGKLAQTYMSKGQYVPDDVTVKMVRERLADISRRRDRVRRLPADSAQAEALDSS
jgi:adenylate kinase family enzyme